MHKSLTKSIEANRDANNALLALLDATERNDVEAIGDIPVEVIRSEVLWNETQPSADEGDWAFERYLQDWADLDALFEGR